MRLSSPSGERVCLAQLTKVTTTDGAEEIYREGQTALHRCKVLRPRS
jgi:cobalt-zinc-cadmium resistance protein CzcA